MQRSTKQAQPKRPAPIDPETGEPARPPQLGEPPLTVEVDGDMDGTPESTVWYPGEPTPGTIPADWHEVEDENEPLPALKPDEPKVVIEEEDEDDNDN
jgi:hypothetical protein